MSGRFAGANSVDDRRRRRLAADEPAVPVRQPAVERTLPTRRPTGRFPLRRIVPRSPWKAAGLGVVALTTAVFTLAVGHLAPVRSGSIGPAATEFLAVDGRLPRTLAGLMLLVAGQLAWLIRWARGRSLRDFHGRYRLWGRVASLSIFAAVALLTDAHVAAAQTLVWLAGVTPVQSAAQATYATLCWTVPAALVLILMAWPLQREMSGCRVSRGLMLCAVGIWLTALGLQIAFATSSNLLPRLFIEVPATAGLLIGATAAATGLLFHAQHVVYVCAEPPELPPRRRAAASAAKRRVEGAAVAPAMTAGVQAGLESDGLPMPVPKRASARKASPGDGAGRRRKTAVESATLPAIPLADDPVASDVGMAADAASEVTVGEDAAPPTDPATPEPVACANGETQAFAEIWDDRGQARVEADDSRSLRLDGPEPSLKGLSKRERRKLQASERANQRDRR